MKAEPEKNESERICDSRRMALRKMMAELSTWASDASKNSVIDTNKTINGLQNLVANMSAELEKIS